MREEPPAADDAPPPPPPPAPEPAGPVVHWTVPDAGPPPRFRIRGVVGRTFDTYGADPFLFLALALPSALVSGAIAAFPGILTSPAVVLLLVAAGLVGLVAAVLTMLATDEMWSGREPALGALLTRAFRRSGSLLVAYLAAGIVLVPLALVLFLGLGTIPPQALVLVALVAVGVLILASLRLTPIGQVIVLEGVGGLASFRRTWDLTRGVTWRLLGLVLLVALVTLPVSLGAQLMATLSPEPVVDGLSALLATMVSTPILAISTTLVWADLAGRPYTDNAVVARGRRRGRAVALVLGLGLVLSVAGISGGGASGLANLLPRRGEILAGTERRAFDPCQPAGVRTTFSASEEVYVGGYFSEPIPPNQSALVEVYVDGTLTVSEPITSGTLPTGCYYEESSLRGSPPASYRIVVRLDERVIGEGSFVIGP